MAVGDIIQVVTEVAGPATERLVNVWHYAQQAGVANAAPDDMPTIAAAFDTQLATIILAILSTNCTYGQTVVTFLTGASAGFQGISNASTGIPGASSGSPGTIERALLVRKFTSRVGRKYRGRVYLPCPCEESFTAEGLYDPTNPDFAIQSAGIALVPASVVVTQDAGVISYSPVIFHRGTLTHDTVTGAGGSSLVGIQRRRRIGVGD